MPSRGGARRRPYGLLIRNRFTRQDLAKCLGDSSLQLSVPADFRAKIEDGGLTRIE